MNILIIGCSKAGAALAADFDNKGHDVSVIDNDPDSFDALPARFSGFTTTGIQIDDEVLKRAGIQTCDALFAMDDDDDINIMVSQLARRIFCVPKVFAKISDIRKGDIFETDGVQVVCPTKLTVAAAASALGDETDQHMMIGAHGVIFTTIDVPEELIGSAPPEIEYVPGEELFGVIRPSSGLIMYSGQPLVFDVGDKLIFARKD